MGKFDGVLIASDFDNTIVYTEDALYAGAPTPDISPENRAAIELLHIAPENFYCIGDHANDIPMLRLAHIPFAPANAIAPVRQVPGIRVLPDCRENALAEMIRQLGELY